VAYYAATYNSGSIYNWSIYDAFYWNGEYPQIFIGGFLGITGGIISLIGSSCLFFKMKKPDPQTPEITLSKATMAQPVNGNIMPPTFYRIAVPTFMDSKTSSEIVAQLKNDTQDSITSIHINFSKFVEYFEIENEFTLNNLEPGMEIEKRFKIRPKFETGTFPVKVKISADGMSHEEIYTIKVGGTEIY
jgi:hypothetical protein